MGGRRARSRTWALSACAATVLGIVLLAQIHLPGAAAAAARTPAPVRGPQRGSTRSPRPELAEGRGSRAGVPVRVWQDTIVLPTYEEGAPDPNPPFDLLATSRFNYPYTLRQNLSDRRVAHAWRALHLENEYLACTVLPDLGGHLYRCLDRLNGADLFYANPSIKFARIAYRGAWTALGIEFNFPVSHNWMTASPVDFAMTNAKDGSASIWVGNIDRAYGMQWRVQLTLRPRRAVLEQHTTLYNRGDTRHRFYWWTNAGVQVQDDSRILYPMRFTAAHGFADIDTWPVNSAGVDLSLVGNHTFGPVSRFAHGSREPFMAVYHPRSRSGVVHYSSPTDLPAKKIWSWGSDADGLDWRRALSDNNSAYVEVQAGLFRNQETYAFLEPQQSIHFSEYWIPIRGIGGVSRANPDAVVNVSRPDGAGTRRVRIALNVTRALPGATVTVSQGARPVSRDRVSLSPANVFAREYDSEIEPVTVVIRDSAGRDVLRHTENAYDYLPASEVKLGPQPAHRYPPADSRTEGDWAAIATQQELDGQLLIALDSYREGLRRFPDSLQLNRAAGRLAVTLKQYEFAQTCLSKVMSRQTTDYESAYYLALAILWRDERPGLKAGTYGVGSRLQPGTVWRARALLEAAQQYGTFRSAALFALAALDARSGDTATALAILQRLTADETDAVRAGGVEVALLRTQKRTGEAAARLAFWLQRDPTSSFLRNEATRLGRADQALWRHLAADPERILEIAVDYMRFGLFDDALAVVSRKYPTGEGIVGEPGMPRPEAYPLIAYYRAYCHRAVGQDGVADLRDAAAMPTTYVFPNRADTLPVLRDALAADGSDATAHFLLGSLYLSGGMLEPAMDAWETARRINPRIPVLHRNMGATLLQTGGSLDRAVTLLQEGTAFDRDNVGLYVTLEQAMTRAGRPADERARAILSFPDQKALPTALVFRLATALAEAGRFDDAERQFEGRFFAREEGGVNVRQVYLEVRARRAAALAAQNRCEDALAIVNHLAEPVAGLAFTGDGLVPFLTRGTIAELIGKVRSACAR